MDPAQYRQSMPEGSASGSRPVSRQKSPPVDPAQYPVRGVRPSQYPARGVRQWIPAVDPAQYPASGSRLAVSRQSAPVDPAQYPARVVRQWIPPSIPPEWSEKWSASGSRPVSRQKSPPVDPAQFPARGFHQWILPSIPPKVGRSLVVARRQPAQTPAKRSLSNFHLVIQKVCASKALWQRKRWTHFLADQVAGVEGGDGSKRCNYLFIYFGDVLKGNDRDGFYWHPWFPSNRSQHGIPKPLTCPESSV